MMNLINPTRKKPLTQPMSLRTLTAGECRLVAGSDGRNNHKTWINLDGINHGIHRLSG